MLKLHGFAQSGNTFKVAFLLRALGVPWQPVAMSFAEFAGGATRLALRLARHRREPSHGVKRS